MVSKATDFVKVIGQGHGECILRYLKDSWENSYFSNVTIICRDQLHNKSSEGNLFANKFVLAAASNRLAQVLDGTEDDVVMIVPDYDRSTFKLLLEYIHSGQIYLETPSEDFEKLLREWDIHFPEASPVEPQKIDTSSTVSIKVPSLNNKDIPNLRNKQTGNGTYPVSSNSQVLIEVCKLDSNSAEVQSIAEKKLDFTSKEKNSNRRKIARISQENDINSLNLAEPKTEKPAKSGRKINAVDNASDAGEETDGTVNKDDLLSSLNLLKEEQRINQEMAENISNLTDTVRRYKVYARHLLGVETSDSNLEKSGKNRA